MGLFSRLKGISEPVDAEFRIVACSRNDGNAVYENCTMDGVVSGAGFDPVAVHHTSMVTPTAKWPYPGVVLPVSVDRLHPERLKINWGAVPNSRDVARALATQQATQMTAEAGQARRTPGIAGAAFTVATVLAAHEVPAGGAEAAPGGVWDLTLDVTATPGYTTVLRVNFSSPEKRQRIAVVGRELPVLSDPSRHDRIAIDTTRL
jgi:hypothetical protein